MKNAAYFFTNGQSVKAGYKESKTCLKIDNIEVEMIKTPRVAQLHKQKVIPRAGEGRTFDQGLFAPVIIDGKVCFFTSVRMKQDKYGGVALAGIINDSDLTSFDVDEINQLSDNDKICYETVNGEILLPDVNNGIKVLVKKEGVDPDRYDKLAACILDLRRKNLNVDPESFIVKNEQGEYVIDEEYMKIFEEVVERNLTTKTIPVEIAMLGESKGRSLEGEELKKITRKEVMLSLRLKIQEKRNNLNNQNKKKNSKI